MDQEWGAGHRSPHNTQTGPGVVVDVNGAGGSGESRIPEIPLASPPNYLIPQIRPFSTART